jgi:hypothetical protein
VRSSLFFYSVRIRDKHPGSEFSRWDLFFFFLIIIRYFCFEFFVYRQFLVPHLPSLKFRGGCWDCCNVCNSDSYRSPICVVTKFGNTGI